MSARLRAVGAFVTALALKAVLVVLLFFVVGFIAALFGQPVNGEVMAGAFLGTVIGLLVADRPPVVNTTTTITYGPLLPSKRDPREEA